MDSYISSFTKLAGAVKTSPKGAEDYFDRLNYVITPAMLLVIATIVGMKQYVFQPIQCWSKQEINDMRMEYAENYCWVENTFHYHPLEAIPKSGDFAKGRTIYYYQWVPFILMAQAALFYVPHLVWLLLSCNAGIDIRQLSLQSRSLETDTEEAERKKKISFLSSSVQKFIRYSMRYRNRSCCRKWLWCMGGAPSFSMYLVLAFQFVKLLYIANCIGQLHLMRAFLGLNMSTFGLNLLNDIVNERTWHTTNVFPRVTYCKFDVREVGEGQTYVLQCVLPVNMLNEKFYIMIWFWVVAMFCLNLFSLCKWSLRLLVGPGRKRATKKFLKIAESVLDFRRVHDIEDSFVERFSKSDGAFLLNVISKNAGDIVTAEVVVDIFSSWVKDAGKLKDRSLEFDSKQEGVPV